MNSSFADTSVDMSQAANILDKIPQEVDVASAVDQVAPAVQAGMFDTMKEKMSWDYIKNNVDFSKERLGEIGLYLGLGFVIGFFSKKFYRYIIALAVLSIILTGLHHISLVTVTIDWERMYQFFGVRPVETLDQNTFNLVLEWCKKNSVALVSCAVGFTIGVKTA